MKNKKNIGSIITILIIIALLIGGYVFLKNLNSEPSELENNNSFGGLSVILKTDENSILIGETQIITFWAKIQADEYKGLKSLPLKYYKDDTIFDYLYDVGDGVYTNQFEMSSDIRECIEYYVEFNGDTSNLQSITFYRPFTDEDWQERDIVAEKVESIISTYQYTGSDDIDYNNAVKIIEDLITYLENQISLGIVEEYRIDEATARITLKSGMTFIAFFEFIPGFQSAPSKNISVINNQSRTSNTLNNFKQKIAVLEPFHSKDFKFNEFDNAAKKTEKSINNYEFSLNLDDTSVTIEILQNLSDYRVITICTHGGWDEIDHSYFLTGELYSKDVGERYKEYFNKRYLLVSVGGYVIVTTDFFREVYKDKPFNNSLIYIGSCNSMTDDELWKTLYSCGAQTIIGYKNSVYGMYNKNMCKTIFDELSKRKKGVYNNIFEAINTAKSKHGQVDNTSDNFFAFLAKLAEYLNSDKIEKDSLEKDSYDERAELILKGNENFRLSDKLNEFANYDITIEENTTITPSLGDEITDTAEIEKTEPEVIENSNEIHWEQYLIATYEEFIKQKRYETDIMESWEYPMKSYAILDIDENGIPELIIHGIEGDFSAWSYDLIYSYNTTDKKIILIDDTYHYAEIRYSTKNKAIEYQDAPPFGGYGESCFYSLNDFSLSVMFSINRQGSVGEYYTLYQNGEETRLSEEEGKAYFSELEILNYKDIELDDNSPVSLTNNENIYINNTINSGNSTGNITNGGYFAADLYNDTIYFAKDTQPNSYMLTSIKTKDKNLTYYICGEYAKCINYYKDNVYYINDNQNENTNKGIYKYDINSKKHEQIIDKLASILHVYDNKLFFYIKDDGIYSTDLNGNNVNQIYSGKVLSMAVSDNMVFYSTSEAFFSYHINNQVQNQIYDRSIENFAIQDGIIYFSATSEIIKMDLNGSGRHTLISQINTDYVDINVQGDYVYYIINTSSDWINSYGNIYRTNINGGNERTVATGKFFYIYMIGDWLYTANFNDGLLYKIKPDGSSGGSLSGY